MEFIGDQNMQINEMVPEIVWSLLVHFLLKNYKLMNYTQISVHTESQLFKLSTIMLRSL